MLRQRLYQRHGRVLERRDRVGRTLKGVVVSALALLAAGLAAYSLLYITRGEPLSRWEGPQSSLAVAVRLGLYLALPVCAWRFMHTADEYMVGFALFAQAAFLSTGGHFSFQEMLFGPGLAVPAVLVGLAQHRRYRELEARLGRQHLGGRG